MHRCTDMQHASKAANDSPLVLRKGVVCGRPTTMASGAPLANPGGGEDELSGCVMLGGLRTTDVRRLGFIGQHDMLAPMKQPINSGLPGEASTHVLSGCSSP